MPDHPEPRVVHVITGLGTGGAEHSLLALVAGRGGSDRSTVVSLLPEGPVAERLAAAGASVHCLGMRRGRAGPLDLVRLARLLRHLRPDLVQAWMYHANLAAAVARPLALTRFPLAWNVRHTPGELRREKPLTGAVIRAGALASRTPRAIVYNSWASARRHEELGYARDRRRVIPNGFDTERFRPRREARARIRAELGFGTGDVVVGLVARYHPIKDHATFLAAARLVAAAAPGAGFVLAGRGVDPGNEPLRRQVEELGLAARVRLLGERRDVADLMAAFDVACLASRGEGLPNVVGEAMACGVPCVVTDVGDAAWVVGETGVVVPRQDPSALAAGIRELVELDPAARRARGAAARERIVRELSLDRMLERYDTLYSELLNVRTRRHRPERPAS